MGALGQLGLLIWKNLILRVRQPVVLLLQVIWPLAILLVVVLVRHETPPTKVPTCHYQERAMPSGGSVQFVQNFVCSVNNYCDKKERPPDGSKMAEFLRKLAPIASDTNGTQSFLKDLPVTVDLLTSLTDTLKKPEIKKFIDMELTIGSLFKNPERVKQYLADEKNLLSRPVVDAILQSTLNFTTLLNLTGFRDLKGIVCTPSKLKEYLVLPSKVDMAKVSSSLCNINESYIPEITQVLQKELSISKIVTIAARLEGIQGNYTVAKGLEDIAIAWGIMSTFNNTADLLTQYPQLLQGAAWLKKASKFLESLEQRKLPDFKTLNALFKDMDPFVKRWTNNALWWQGLKDNMRFMVGLYSTYFPPAGSSDYQLLKYFQLHSGTSKNTPTAQGFNVTNIISHGIDTLRHFGQFSKDMLPLMNSLTAIGVQDTWNSLAKTAGVLTGAQPMETMINMVTPGLAGTEAWMRSQPWWPDACSLLASQRITLEYNDYFLYQLAAMDKHLLKLINDDETIKDLGTSILKSGPYTTQALGQLVANPKFLKDILDNPNKLELYFCDETKLATYLPMVSKTNIAALKDILCGRNWNKITDKLKKLFQFDEMQEKFEKVLQAYSGKADCSDPEWAKRANLTQVYIMSVKSYSNMNKLFVAGDGWHKIIEAIKPKGMDLNTKKWQEVFAKMQENFGYGTAGVLLQKWGPVLENSTVWTYIGPQVKMYSGYMEMSIKEMKRITGLLGNHTLYGKMVFYMANYGPDLLESLAGAIASKEKMKMLTESKNIGEMLCDPNQIRKVLVVGNHVPLLEMQKFVCTLNVTAMGQEMADLMSMGTRIEKSMQGLHSMGTTQNERFDWANLMDNFKTMQDMYSQMYATATSSMKIDMNRYMDAAGKLMKAMGGMSYEQLSSTSQLQAQIMEMVMNAMSDKSMLKTTKYYVHVANLFMKAFNVNMDKMKGGKLHIKDLLHNSTRARQLVEAQSGISRDVMGTIMNAMVQPDRMIVYLMTKDFTNKSLCNGISLNDLMKFQDPESVKKYENMVCTMTEQVMNEMWTEIKKDPAVIEYTEAVELLNGPLPEVQLNYTEVVTNLMGVTDRVMKMKVEDLGMAGNLVGFNLTEMQTMTDQMTQKMKTINIQDVFSLSKLSEVYVPLLKNLSSMSHIGQQIWLQVENNMLMFDSVMKFASLHFKKLNGTKTLNILDFMNSTELWKLARGLESSPDVLHVVLESIMQKIHDPKQIQKLMSGDWGSFCTNKTAFKEIFVQPANSSISIEKMQTTVCQLAINETKLWQQLASGINGINTYIQQMQKIFAGQKLDGKADLSQIINNYNVYQKFVEHFSRFPPNIKSGLTDKWMDAANWKKIMDKYYKQGQTYLQQFQANNMFSLTQQLLPLFESSLTKMITDSGLAPSMSAANVIMKTLSDRLGTYVGKNMSLEEIFQGHPESMKAVRLLNHMDVMIKVILHSSVYKPTWFSPLLSGGFTEFCKLDPNTVFAIPADLNTVFQQLHANMCSIDINKLNTEVSAVLQVNSFAALVNASSSVPLNITALFSNSNKLSAILTSLSGSKTFFSLESLWQDPKLWNSLLQQFGSGVAGGMNLTSIESTLRQMQPVIDYLLMQNGTSQITRTIAESMKATLQMSSLYAKMQTDPLLLLKNASEVQKMLKGLDVLPDLYQVLMASMLNGQKMQPLFTMLATNPATVCTDVSWSKYMTVPNNVQLDVDAVQKRFCNLNYTAIMLELQKVGERTAVPWLKLGQGSLSQETKLNMSVLIQQASQLSTLLSDTTLMANITQNTWGYQWLNMSRWTQAMNNMNKLILGQDMTASIPQYFSAMEQLSQLLNDTSFNGPIHAMNAGVDLVMNKIKNLPNKTHATLEDFLPNSPETRKLLIIMQELPGIMEVLMFSINTPKFQVLFRYNLTQALSKVCDPNTNIDQYVTVPPGSKVDIQGLKTRFCKVDFNKVGQELNKEIEPIMQAAQSKAPVNWNATAHRFAVLSENLTKLNVTFVGSGPWLDMKAWERMLSSVMNQSQPTAQLANLPGMIGPILQVLLANSTGNTAQTVQTLGATVHIMHAYLRFQRDPLSLLENTPQIKKLVHMMDMLPDFMPVLLYSMTNQQKLQPFFTILSTNPSKLCAQKDWSLYLTLPAKSTFNVTLLRQVFCDLQNATALTAEIMQLYHVMYGPWLDMLQGKQLGPMNLTKITSQIADLQAYWTNTSAILSSTQLPGFTFQDPARWQKVAQTFSHIMNNQFNTSTAINQYFSILTQTNQLLNGSAMINGPTHAINKAVEVLVQKLDALPNKTHVALEDFFPNSPETRKMLMLMEKLPQIVDVVTSSYNTPQFQMLFRDNLTVALTKLCHPFNDISKLLRVPQGAKVNLTALKTEFCKINVTQIYPELMSDWKFDLIMAQMQNSAPINYTASAALYSKAVDYFSKIKVVVTRGQWMDETAWLETLRRMSSDVQQTQNALDSMAYSLGLMRQIYGPSADMYLQMYKAYLDYINSILGKLSLGKTKVDLGDLFKNATRFQKILKMTFHLGPKTLQGLMETGVKVDKMAELLGAVTAGQLNDILCSKAKMEQYFILPASFDASVAVNALCKLNTTLLMAELGQEFNVASLMEKLSQLNQGTNPLDLDSLVRSTQLLQNRIAQLVNVTDFHLNGQNLAKLLNMTGVKAEDIKLWQMLQGMDPAMTSVNSASSIAKMMESMLQNMPWMASSIATMKGINLLLSALSDKVSKLPLINITLASVLGNSPSFVQFMEKTFSLSPAIVTAMVESRIDFSKMITIKNATDFQNLFCGRKIILAPQVNEEAFQDVVCKTNFNGIMNELQKEFKIDKLIQQLSLVNSTVFNWTEYIANTERLSSSFTTFFTNATLPSLPAFFRFNGNAQDWNDRMMKALNSPNAVDKDTLRFMGMWLQQQVTTLEQAGYWNQVYPMLQGINLMADALNKRLAHIPVNMTISDVLGNDADHFKAFLQKGFAVTPDIIKGLMTMQINPLELMGNVTINVICKANMKEAMGEEAHRLICLSNYTAIELELRRLVKWDAVLKEFSKIGSSSPPTPGQFNWTTYLLNLQSLQMRIGHFANITTPLPKIFLYHGNYTAWQQKLAQAGNSLAAGGTEYYLNLVLTGLQQGLPTAFPNNAISTQINKATDYLVQMVTDVLRRFTASPFSLDQVFGNAVKVKKLIRDVLGVDQSTLDVVMNATLKPKLMNALMSQPLDQALCQNNINDLIVLPSSGRAKFEDFLKKLCAANSTMLSNELMQEFNLGVVIAEFSKISQLKAFDKVNFNWTHATVHNAELRKVIEDLTKMSPKPDGELNRLFNFTRFLPLVDKIMKQQLNSQLVSQVMSLGSIFESMPELAPTLSVLSGVMKEVNGYLGMGGSMNSLPHMYRHLLESYPKIQQQVMDNLVYKPMFSKAATDARVSQWVCNTTAMAELLGVKAGDRKATTASVALCGRTTSWLEALQNASLSSSDIDQLSTKLKTAVPALAQEMNQYFSKLSGASWASLAKDIQSVIAALDTMFKMPMGGMTNVSESLEFWNQVWESLMKGGSQTSLILLSQVMQGQQPGGSTSAIQKQYYSYLRAANTMAEALNNRLKAPSVKMTLADLLGNNAERFKAFAQKSFAVAPDIVAAMMWMRVDITMLAQNQTAAWWCSYLKTHVADINTTKLRDLVCETNFTLIEMELRRLVNWDTVLQQIAKADAGDLHKFNWTRLSHNLQTLQKNLGHVFMVNTSLAEFFMYDGDMTAWMKRMEKAYNMPMMDAAQVTKLAQQGTNALMQNLQGSLGMDASMTQMYKAMDYVTQMAIDRLRRFTVNPFTLDDVLKDATHLKNMMKTTLGMKQSVINSLMNATIKPNMLEKLIQGQVSWEVMFCKDSIDTVLTLPPGGHVELKQMQKDLCAVNYTIMSQEVMKQLDVDGLVREFSKIGSLKPGEVVQFNWAAAAQHNQQLNEMIQKLVNLQPKPHRDLQSLFNFTRFMPVFEKIMNMQFTSMLSSQVLSLGPMFDRLPTIAPLLKSVGVIVRPLNKYLEGVKAGGTPLSKVLSDPKIIANLVDILTRTTSQDVMEALNADLIWKPQFANLERKPSIKSLVCNTTAVKAILKAPSYIPVKDMSRVMCSLKGAMWYDALKNLSLHYSVIDRLYQELNWMSIHNPTSTGMPTHNPTSTMIMNATSVLPIPRLQVQSSKVIRDVQTFVDLVQQLMKNPDGSMIKFDEKTIQALITGLSNGNSMAGIESIINTLKQRDSLFWNDHNWAAARKTFHGVALALEHMNKQLKKLTSDGKTLKLESMWPDSKELVSVLQSSLGPGLTAEILAASVDPSKFMTAMTENTLCTKAVFDKTFSFPPSVDATNVQKKMCEAVKSGTLLLKRLTDSFDMGEFLKKLDKLTKEGSGQVNPWDLLLKQGKELLNNVGGLVMGMEQHGVNTATIGKWFEPITAFLESTTTSNRDRYGRMCDAVGPLLSATGGRSEYRQLLKTSHIISDLLSRYLTMLPALEKTVCEIERLNITSLYGKLKEMKFFETWNKAEKAMRGETSEWDTATCESLVNLEFKIYEQLNQTFTKLPKSLKKVMDCMAHTADKNVYLFTQVDGLASMIKDANRLMSQAPQLPQSLMSSMTSWQPVVDLVLKGLFQQEPVLVKFQDLLKNGTGLTQFFTEVLQMSPKVVDSVLQASVNLDLASLYNSTDSELRNIFCSPSKLQKVIQVSAGVNITGLSSSFCGVHLNSTISAIRQSINTGKIVLALANRAPVYRLNTKWFNLLLEDVSKLLKDFESLSALVGALDGVDVNKLEKFLPKLAQVQQFLVDGGPMKVSNGIISVVNDFSGVISNPLANSVLADLRKVATGVRSLNILKKYFAMDVRIKEGLRNPVTVEKLAAQLKISPDIAQGLLDSSLTISQIVKLSSMDIVGLICNGKRLGTILTVSANVTTNTTAISKLICSVDKDTAVNMTQWLIGELEIGNLLKTFIKLSPSDMLKKFNVDGDAIKKTLSKLNTGDGGLNDLMRDIGSVTQEINLPSVASQLTSGSANQALKSMSKALCGSENALDIQDAFGLTNRLTPKQRPAEPQSTASPPISDGVPGSGQAPKNSSPTSSTVVKDTSTPKPPRQITELWQKSELVKLPSKFCKDMFLQILDTKGGSIIWAYVKPLLRGKILYTPNTPAITKLMKDATWLFSGITKIQDMAKTWMASGNSLSRITGKSDSLKVLKEALHNPFVAQAVQELAGVSGNDLISQMEGLTNLSTSTLDRINYLAGMVYNISQCLEPNRLEAMPTEQELEKRAASLNWDKSILAAIVFIDDKSQLGARRKRAAPTNTSLPKHVKYKIRMDIDNVQMTKRLKDLVWRPGPEDDFAESLRYLRGFIQLQDLIEQAIIKEHTGSDAQIPKVGVKQMPYPCYMSDNIGQFYGAPYIPIVLVFLWFINVGIGVGSIVYQKEMRVEERRVRKSGFYANIKYTLTVLLILAWAVPVATSLASLVLLKEGGRDEMMKMMGMRSGANWLAWFLDSFGWMVIISTVTVLFLKFGNMMPNSNMLIVWLVLLDFSLVTTMFCYLVSVFFTKTMLAALTGMMVYLISYLPFVVLVTMEEYLKFWHVCVTCISATTAFGHATKLISRYEQQGPGIQWDNIDINPERTHNFTVAWACYMMLIDAVAYGIIAWYIRNVFPGKYGIAQPWYFPVLGRYWGCCTGATGGKPRYSYTSYKNEAFHHDDTDKTKKPAPVEESGITVQAVRTLNDEGKVCHEAQGPDRPRQLGPGEPEPKDLPIGISLQNLRKQFKKKVAVENLTVNFYQGQITALLGHNGAGKTTTLNLLTGMFPPSAGTAYVDGRNIIQDFQQIRENLGICPQQDILFEYMTVLEHMKFFASLKASKSKSGTKEEMNRILDIVGLRSMLHVKASELSGGQRRRLSVACAFIGGSRVIILDEPTSGVDPAARRNIWDLIVAYREGRTIVLCTHHLDEADLLGDRIVVLHQGKLVCSGSSMFLKTQYGSGYRLTMAKDVGNNRPNHETSGHMKDKFQSDEVMRFIKAQQPDASLMEEIGTEMTVILPIDQGQVASFPQLFQELEGNKERLHIASYGVSDTTLEEVFLKVTYQAECCEPLDGEKLRRWTMKGSLDGESQSDSGLGDAGASIASTSDESTAVGIDPKRPKLSGTSKVTGLGLKMRQFRALMTKRFHHHKRDLKTYISTIILPVLFVCLAMGCTLIKPNTTDQPPLTLTPALYGPDSAMFFKEDSHSKINQKMVSSMFHSPGLSTTCMRDSFSKKLCIGQHNGKFIYPPPSSGQSGAKCSCQTGWQVCPAGAEGQMPPYMMTNTSNYLYNLTEKESVHQWIVDTQHKFVEKRYGGWSFGGNSTDSKATVWYNNKGWHSLPAFYNSLSNMALRANLHSTQNPAEYGITVINHPLSLSKEQLSKSSVLEKVADVGIALTILCAFCFVPASFIVYVVNERIHKEKRLQMICGVGVGIYWTTALLWDMLTYLLTVGLAVAVAAAFQIPIYVARLNLLGFAVLLILFGWATIPIMYLMSRGFKNTSTAYMVMFIFNLFIGLNTCACMFLLSMFSYSPHVSKAREYLQYIFMIFPQYCLGDGLVQLSYNQIISSIYAQFRVDIYNNPIGFKVLGWQLVAMAICGLFFFIIHLMVEARWCTSCTARVKKGYKPDHKEDSDVSLERQRVITGGARDDILVINNLSKFYRRGFKNVLAVDNICLGIGRGECFGLLGVNGAGKTTTFKMITGDVSPTSGTALFHQKLISQDESNMDNKLGYCPQIDALDGLLTGDEMVYCYCRLKGIPEEDIKKICNLAMWHFNLESSANKTVKSYSGGTKRKLSTVIALLGDPDIVLMDEPTSGMDPQTRRLVWNNIINVMKDQRSVVLTSHSMEECQALCTRMAIMVNGTFMCLGNSQHLKNKFGDGYTLTLRVGGSEAHMQTVIEYIYRAFDGAILKDQHLNMIEFHIPSQSSQLSAIFSHMENQKEALKIEDYSVSQTTLDQVFIHFSKHQTDGTLEPLGEEEDSSSGSGSGSSTLKKNQAFINKAYEMWGDEESKKRMLDQPQYLSNIMHESEMREALQTLPKDEKRSGVEGQADAARGMTVSSGTRPVSVSTSSPVSSVAGTNPVSVHNVPSNDSYVYEPVSKPAPGPHEI